MNAFERRIRLGARLSLAADMLAGVRSAADIGCDHGRLACALAQRDEHCRVIAVDISADSLNKCARLAEHVGVDARVETRLGDGLHVLENGEAEAIAILGMGGALIARILTEAEPVLSGAKLAVLSPMRGTAELRSLLYSAGYHMRSDRIVRDAGRLYQVFAVSAPDGQGRDILPEGWPDDCFEIGYRAFENRDPLLAELAKKRLAEHEKRLRTAGDSAGAKKLRAQADHMRAILKRTGDFAT